MKHLDELLNKKEMFFRYLAERFPVFTGSNVFLRDIQYGIKFYFEKKNVKLKYPEAEQLAIELTNKLTENNELVKSGKNTWKVNFVFEEEILNASENDENDGTQEETK